VAGLFELFADDSKRYGPAALGVVLASALVELACGRMSRERRDLVALSRGEQGLIVIMLLFCAIPIAVWALSRLIEPQFLPRYFLPDVLVWAYAFAFALRAQSSSGVVPSGVHAERWQLRTRKWLPRLFTACIAAVYLLVPVVWTHRWTTDIAIEEWPEATKGLPIVVEDLRTFLPRQHYASSREKYLFVLDKHASTLPAAHRMANNLDQYAAALRRNYPRINIITTNELLEQYAEFYVLDSPGLLWYETNVEKRPELSCERLSVALC
jgi:hypothetical protein